MERRTGRRNQDDRRYDQIILSSHFQIGIHSFDESLVKIVSLAAELVCQIAAATRGFREMSRLNIDHRARNAQIGIIGPVRGLIGRNAAQSFFSSQHCRRSRSLGLNLIGIACGRNEHVVLINMFDDRPLGQRAVELEVAPCYETVQLLGERARDFGHIFRLEMSFEHAVYHIRRYLDQTERTLAAASTGNLYLVSRHVHVRNGRLERLGQIIRFVVGQLVQYIARSSLFGRSGTEVNVPDLDVDALFLAQIDAQVIFRSAPRHVNGLKAQIDRPLSPRVAVAGSFLARDPGGRNRTRLHHARRGQRLGEIKLHVPYGRIAPILESQHA